MKNFIICIICVTLALSGAAQERVRVVRWINPATGDFESMPEGRHSDAQLSGWGYKDKTYQYSAYKTKPNDANATAVYRWSMPKCAGSIMFGEHELTDAQLQQWGYTNKEFQFYAFRTKPSTGEYVSVNRWINKKPPGDKCRDFTMTVAQTEFTDTEMRANGYSEKLVQFWVPNPKFEFVPKEPDFLPIGLLKLKNPDFESGDLRNWTNTANGFGVKSGDIPSTPWAPKTVPLGGNYWQGLTHNFKWNNGRQKMFYVSSENAGQGRYELISSEFISRKKFITFLMAVNWTGANWRASVDLPKLRVELLVADNGTALEKTIGRVNKKGPTDPKTGKPITIPVIDRVKLPQTIVDNTSYSIVETIDFTTSAIPAPQQFYRNYLTGYPGTCRLRVVDETSNGSILIDDIQMEDTQGTPITSTAQQPLWGFVDMHTHPMSYLGFGKKLIHGAPDVGALIPAGTRYKGFDLFNRECNTADERSASMSQGMSCCNATHGGAGADNDCGNTIRNIVIGQLEGQKGAQSAHGNDRVGYPTFSSWPKHNDITHQQMWVDWIRRAHQGGLRVMVALAVNNRTLAESVNGDAPLDDKGSGDLQINELKNFVGRHTDFMEIAYSPTDLRRINKLGKLAILVGVELDDIGNFNTTANLSQEAITAEIQRLFSLGVRYIFPVHVIDNKFGGTAAYEHLFNRSNRHLFGKYWNLTCASPGDSINYRFDASALWDRLPVDILGAIRFGILDGPPSYPNCQSGQKNSRGLTNEGAFAIQEMMKRGMIIDIDHMSQLTADATLNMARTFQYPVNSGHNGVRGAGGTENSRTKSQLDTIARLGGLMGVGWENTNAQGFLTNYRISLAAMGNRQIAFGTDINGLVKAPGQGVTDIYASGLTKCQTGTRTWDYRTEGVAHYGLFPDFLQDLRNLDMRSEERSALFSGAEYFVRMWEKCEQQKTLIP